MIRPLMEAALKEPIRSEAYAAVKVGRRWRGVPVRQENSRRQCGKRRPAVATAGR